MVFVHRACSIVYSRAAGMVGHDHVGRVGGRSKVGFCREMTLEKVR